MENLKKAMIIRNGNVVGAVGDKNFSTLHVGCVIPFAGNTDNIPRGYLLADGASYPTTEYPDLYAVIGNTYGGDTENFNVPDYRETVLVGVGENTTDTIASHDVYELGEFKDDQFQGHEHNTYNNYESNATGGAGSATNYGGVVHTFNILSDGTNGEPRKGTTTHGKQKGVTYIIKAFHTNEGVDSKNEVSDPIIEYVEGEIAEVESKVDGLISDTSSTTSTYSSAKIDEKYGAYIFGTADATQWLKLTLGNSSKFQPIVISDQYGGKVEITGMADDGTYKSVKLVRYSYGDWNTYSATDYTLYDGVDPNYKIQRLFYYPTNGCYYLEIRQWCTIKVSGAISKPEMVTSLPAETSAMTLIPESNWGRIDDTSTGSTTSTWSSSMIASQINNAIAIKYNNVIGANATKETGWNLAQGESHFYGRLLQLDGHLGSKSSTFSFLLFVKANYDNPTTVYATQLAGMDDDRSNIAHTTYFELGVSSSGNLTITNKSAVAASYRFI